MPREDHTSERLKPVSSFFQQRQEVNPRQLLDTGFATQLRQHIRTSENAQDLMLSYSDIEQKLAALKAHHEGIQPDTEKVLREFFLQGIVNRVKELEVKSTMDMINRLAEVGVAPANVIELLARRGFSFEKARELTEEYCQGEMLIHYQDRVWVNAEAMGREIDLQEVKKSIHPMEKRVIFDVGHTTAFFQNAPAFVAESNVFVEKGADPETTRGNIYYAPTVAELRQSVEENPEKLLLVIQLMNGEVAHYLSQLKTYASTFERLPLSGAPRDKKIIGMYDEFGAKLPFYFAQIEGMNAFLKSGEQFAKQFRQNQEFSETFSGFERQIRALSAVVDSLAKYTSGMRTGSISITFINKVLANAERSLA